MAHLHGKVSVQFSMKKKYYCRGYFSPGGYFSPALLSGGHFNLLLKKKTDPQPVLTHKWYNYINLEP